MAYYGWSYDNNIRTHETFKYSCRGTRCTGRGRGALHKNPKLNALKNVYTLSDVAEYVLFMSGTPLENRIDEMKQLVTQLNPSIGNQLSEHFYKLEPNNFKKRFKLCI